MELVKRLEAIGFRNFFTYRRGPCFQCEQIVLTFYNPELKRWYCESCWYETDFISELELLHSENTMSVESRLQMLEQALKERDEKIAKLTASSTDNVFVGSQSDNLTLKFRQINPKAWGVPTKSQNGQGYFRCSDFPFSFDLVKGTDGNPLLRAYTAIPISAREAELFQTRFIAQQIVFAKKRQTKEEETAKTATQSAFGPTPSPSPSPSASTPAATPTGPVSFSQLPESDRIALSKKADELFAIPGLFKDKLAALRQAISDSGRSITIP